MKNILATGMVLVEAFEDIGNYLSMITNAIGQYTETFDTDFPTEYDNPKQDYISKYTTAYSAVLL